MKTVYLRLFYLSLFLLFCTIPPVESELSVTDRSVGLPAVVGARLGGIGHFIAVLAVDGDQIAFADPMVGERHISIAQFRHRYQFTGFHIVVTKA